MFHRTQKLKNLLPAIYVSAFFLSLHFAVTLFVDSSFLSEHFSSHLIGIIYTLGSFLTIILISLMPKILSRFGNYAIALSFTITEIILLFLLPVLSDPIAIAGIFILHTCVVTLLFFNFDVFTESNSQDETTGKTRGIFLTAINLATVFGPLLAGLFIFNSNFSKVYTLSAIFVFPVLLITALRLKTFKDPEYREFQWKGALQKIRQNKNIRSVCTMNFLLHFFYSWMVIYMPVYLNTRMGFDWGEIGVIFGIMLLPFVFFELPLGEIADKRLGEKEILVAGFVILSFSTLSLSFIQTASLALWTTVLFLTRIGAAAVEIMSETYFFKKIDASDTDTLSFFRHMRPIAFIAGPLIASIFLSFFDIQYLFLPLGLFMLFGIRYALLIEDTR